MTRHRWAALVVALYLAAFVAAAFGAWLLAVAVLTAPAYIGIGWLLHGQHGSAEIERLIRENNRLRAHECALEDELTAHWDRRSNERYSPWPDNGPGYRSDRFTSDSPVRQDAGQSQQGVR